MLKIDFNDNWRFKRLNGNEEWQNIELPHDAAIFEKRSAE